MADGFKPIPRCQPGGISLVSAEYANQLIDVLNAVGGGRVAPFANVGSFKLAGGQFILDLSAFDTRLKALESGSAGSSSLNLPFVIQQSGNSNVVVQPGLVHGINVVGTATNIAMSGNSAINIYINCTIDNNGTVTNAVIGNTTGNVPNDTDYQAYKWVGVVQSSSGNVGAITQYTYFSQEFSACDRNISDPASAPGTYKFFVD